MPTKPVYALMELMIVLTRSEDAVVWTNHCTRRRYSDGYRWFDEADLAMTVPYNGTQVGWARVVVDRLAELRRLEGVLETLLEQALPEMEYRRRREDEAIELITSFRGN